MQDVENANRIILDTLANIYETYANLSVINTHILTSFE